MGVVHVGAYSIEGIWCGVLTYSITFVDGLDRGGVCMKLEERSAFKIFRRNSDTRDPIFYPFF